MQSISQNFAKDQRLMQPHKKGVRMSRSREDYNLFKITLPSFSPEVVQNVIIYPKRGEYLRPGRPFAKVFYRKSPPLGPNEEPREGESQDEQELSTHLAGTIERIGPSFEEVQGGWGLREGLKRGPLELLWVRECVHEIQNQSMENSNNRANFNLPAGQICPLCQKQIWIYSSPTQEIVTAQDLIRANQGLQLKDFLELEWSIIVNEQFTPTTSIVKIADRDINYQVLAKATYLIGEGERPTFNTPVMKIKRIYCRHEKIYEKRCQHCLQLIEREEAQEFRRYLFQMSKKQHERALTKGTALARQEEQYISELVSRNKLILILDLDNTILHSNEMSNLELGQLLKIKEYFIIQKVDLDSDGKLRQDYVLVKMRPFIQQFLFVINKLFEVYIYTKGTRIYADEICRCVRSQWAGDGQSPIPTWPEKPLKFLKDSESFLPYRVVSRNEDNSLDTKSMGNILPNRTEYHVILDDRRDVWGKSPSWYYTRDYFYFHKRERIKNAVEDVDNFLANDKESPVKEKLVELYEYMRKSYPPKPDTEIQLLERKDYFLLFTAHTFKKMHKYFFEHLNKVKEGKLEIQTKNKDHPVSLASIMQRLKLFMFKKKLRFFMAGGFYNFDAISTVRRAFKMGANIVKDLDNETPDYVIRGDYFVKFAKEYMQLPRFDLEGQSMKENDQKNVSKQSEEKNEEKFDKQKSEKNQQKLHSEEPESPEKNTISNRPMVELLEAVKIDEPKKQRQRTYGSELEEFTKYVDEGIPIISEAWISTCYEYSYEFRPKDFRILDPLKDEVKIIQFNDVIVKAAERIRKDIIEQMTQDGAYTVDEQEVKEQKEIQIMKPEREVEEGVKEDEVAIKKESKQGQT